MRCTGEPAVAMWLYLGRTLTPDSFPVNSLSPGPSVPDLNHGSQVTLERGGKHLVWFRSDDLFQPADTQPLQMKVTGLIPHTAAVPWSKAAAESPALY